ncbi:hypothetical protein AN963_06810 [Brevibacillus choshinensis]|uniref:histidine kinase n=1 Tax=Brevibacillus choshinensis TaxID=54911 RepID=A0ABR5NDI5_BRECH|nr:EAL domain-containing protein [Brevibacillus choshinensis]KQL49454.1 hypothetical protein AN963_06810 [Brevibacillus choshinensis]
MQTWYQRDEASESDDSESDLLRALVRQELFLHYQPVVDLKSGKIIGVEALLRWNHPEGGVQLPKDFLTIAEKGGAIPSIEEWILHTACKQNKKWQEEGLCPFIVSVNISAFPLIQADLVQAVENALLDSKLEPKYLELEITEKMAMDADRTLDILFQLKRLGVSISIDDFGRGYSSLNYLKRFPIDKLKIDQPFVQHSMEDETEESVVKTIIGMAKNLRLQVVAEGVETQEQLVFLQQNLCDAAQGHLISKPVSAERLVEIYTRVQEIVPDKGIGPDQIEQLRKREAFSQARLELSEALKNQQGMTFKFVKLENRYIHTLCEGELMNRMGILSEQIVGKELIEILDPAEAARKTNYYERAWNGEQYVNYEGYINGVNYIAALRPIYQSGKVKEVIASCVDITELKKTEEALRASEAKYRLIAENMSDIIVVLDQGGIITYMSPAVSSVLGVTPEELQDQHILNFILPKEKEKVHQAVEEMIEWKLPKQLSFSSTHRNGSKVILEAKGTPVLDSQGEVQQIILIIRNITAQVHAEEFLRKIDRLAAVGHLAAGVAHEIRNPVTSIKGFVQLLKQDHGKQEYFDIMLAEFQQLENILREFVFLTQERSSSYEQVSVGTILDNVMAHLQEKSLHHKIKIDLTGEQEIIIWCDPTQIRQLFINILSNSIEAMPNGGMIQVSVLPEGHDKVMIRIVDEGCGMSEERLKRLGEPFYSTKEKGTGLGLMISYKIMEYHQGYIHFSSEPQQGTTVEVVFPLDKVRSAT